MKREILDTTSRVVFFPVRHHSPACARLVYDLALEMKPDAILIEGPSDFNLHMSELALDHKLPIAIYSYAQLEDGTRRGAFYPFCDYSPEWQAFQAAKKLNSSAAFIDMPWADMARSDSASHRYADGELRFNSYANALCTKLGVDSFDDVWDMLAEIDPQLTVAQLFERLHTFAYHVRLADGVSNEDVVREAFMASEILRAMDALPGKILVVTGAFHSYALFVRIMGLDGENPVFLTATKENINAHDPIDADVDATTSTVAYEAEANEVESDDEGDDDNGLDETDLEDFVTAAAQLARGPVGPARGIALTPYSYDRLDSLKGYEAGMPGPGFYDHVFRDRREGTGQTYRKILFQAVTDLRARKQFVSAADVIAVESTARALAAIRCHEEVWRSDLIDAILGAVVKEDLVHGCHHPLLNAIHEVLRGSAVGCLATDAALPPLVRDIQDILTQEQLSPGRILAKVKLDLSAEDAVRKSFVLHRLVCLGISGFSLVDTSVMAGGDDEGNLWEEWEIQWTPLFDANCIEAAIYGSTLGDAAAVKLMERASAIDHDSEAAAMILLDACLMGFNNLSAMLHSQLRALINRDNNFFSVTGALAPVLHLYKYDQVLKDKPIDTIGSILYQVFHRSLWLLETLGRIDSMETEFISKMSLLLETFERCWQPLEFDRAEFVTVLQRARAEKDTNPLMLGALTGALWTIGESPLDDVVADMTFFSSPDSLGDFLTGLFAMAREASQHRVELIMKIDEFLMSFSVDDFLQALPSLRLAFSYFTPREKFYISQNLVKQIGASTAPLPALEVSAEVAAKVMAYEERLKAVLERYGLRGGDND